MDIWTCGVSLFVMIFGHYPFDNPDEGTGDDTRSLLARIRSGEVDIPTNRIVKGSLTLVSEDCINLLRNILERDPARRYSIQVSAIWLHLSQIGIRLDAFQYTCLSLNLSGCFVYWIMATIGAW